MQEVYITAPRVTYNYSTETVNTLHYRAQNVVYIIVPNCNYPALSSVVMTFHNSATESYTWTISCHITYLREHRNHSHTHPGFPVL